MLQPAHLRKSTREIRHADAIGERPANMPEERIETEHIVRCARDVTGAKGERIKKALEDRFPTRPVAEFKLKLAPLSVGAWLLVVCGVGDSDYEILGYDCSELEIADVLASADVLWARWREKRLKSDPLISKT